MGWMVARGTGLRWFFATMVAGKRSPRKIMRKQFGETRASATARVERDERGVPGTFFFHSVLTSLSSVMMSDELEKLGRNSENKARVRAESVLFKERERER